MTTPVVYCAQAKRTAVGSTGMEVAAMRTVRLQAVMRTCCLRPGQSAVRDGGCWWCGLGLLMGKAR
ncbi:hypothetical protein SESBI_38422 [Sesbania bispinosa]|nr:hypothetical protein SESBI_38422 [Sesbania bispinosa]